MIKDWGNMTKRLKSVAALALALAAAVSLLVPGRAYSLGLDSIFMDMDTASYSDVRSEASRETLAVNKPKYPNAPASVPFYATFDGYFVPDSNNTQVAIFSDDGVDFYIDGTRVLNNRGRGQALPSLDSPPNPSLIPLNSTWVGGKVYHIAVDFSNIIYTGALDIDGCTMFAYNGGGSIYDSFVDLNTDSNNDGVINDSDQSVEETSPGRHVCRNIDDDNSNSTPDKDETGTVTGEDDLVQVNLAYGPSSGINGRKITLQASAGGSNIKVWTTSDKAAEITLPKTYVIGTDAIPSVIWVEGINAGEAMLDAVMKKSDDIVVMTDKVKFTVAADCAPPTFTDITAVHAAAKCSDQVTITFTASETLSGNPTVTVNGNSVSNLTHTGNDYTCTYTVQEYYDPAGEATIHISGYDLDGNPGEVTDTEALWIVDCATGGSCGNGGFTYDKNGNRKTMCDSRGLTVYFYDVMNRLVRVVEPDEKWIAYEYDGNGNRTKMTTHSDGTPSFEHVTQYSYYDNGLLHEVTDQLDGVTHYTYYDNGLVDTITYPNGTEAIHTYNGRGWLTTISNQKSDNTIIAQFDYTYDPTYWGKNGTRTRVVENILKPDGNRVSAQVDYEYDDLYRLVHEHRIGNNGGDPGVAYEYNFAYDAAGNRASWQTVGGSTVSYSNDAANKMLTSGIYSYTYDDKGNTEYQKLTADQTIVTTYTWDYLNRMTRCVKGQIDESYIYNADNIRVRKTPSGGTATCFLLDGDEIAEEVTGTTMNSHLTYSMVSIVGTVRTIDHMDGIGSIRAVSDGNEAVSQVGIYDAYGNLKQDYPSSSAPSFGYAGAFGYYTNVSGLDYVKTRYYDPASGRFISRDTIGYNGGLNLYAYVGCNPVSNVDPTGEIAPIAIIGIIGGGWFVGCGGIGGIAGTLIGYIGGYNKGDPNRDKVAHCEAACTIRNCGTVVQSWMWGMIKEYIDWWFGFGTFDYNDLLANGQGEECAKQSGGCESCCKCKYPSATPTPGP